MERLNSILSVKKIPPEIETILVFEIDDKELFKLSYEPNLRIEKISADTLNKLDVCKVSLNEDTLSKILDKTISQQDAYNQGLLKIKGKVDQLIEANFIIEALQNVYE